MLLLYPALFLAVPVFADTVSLNNGQSLIGLIVEEHEDRIVLSTDEGEKPVLRKEIKDIQYHESEYDLLNLGRQMEERKQWQEALSYYEQAIKMNPNLTEAREAVAGVRSRLWSKQAEGPIDEVAIRQDLEDAWRASTPPEEIAANRKKDAEKLLWDRLGILVKQRDEWVVVERSRTGGMGERAGLRAGDELTAVDGKSLKYLNEQAVIARLLEPRYASATVQIRRRLALSKPSAEAGAKELGFAVKLRYNGLTVTGVDPLGLAAQHGLKPKDIVVDINARPTRYMPLKEAHKLIRDAGPDSLELKVNRSLFIMRK